MITVLMFLRHFKALLNRAWGTWCSVKIWLMGSCHSYLSVHKIAIQKKKVLFFISFCDQMDLHVMQNAISL